MSHSIAISNYITENKHSSMIIVEIQVGGNVEQPQASGNDE